jgi:hypothetical protein
MAAGAGGVSDGVDAVARRSLSMQPRRVALLLAVVPLLVALWLGAGAG